MPTLLERKASESTWEDYERQVYKLTWTFAERSKTDFKTLLSEAALGYARAYDTYDPNVSEFSTWVDEKVKGALLDYIRKETRRKKPLQFEDGNEELVPQPEQRFDLKRWMQDLSSDAKRVVKLVFSPNQNVKLSMKQLGGESPVNFRMAVREFLEDIGWSKLRINQTFREIKESL